MCADLLVHPLDPERTAAFHTVVYTAFGEHTNARALSLLDQLQPADRRLAASDGDRLVATAGAFSFEMTLPGGASVPTAGVTAVSVAATHRRRGILRQLMAAQLDDVAARGEPLAVLTASEAGIYGRFGYGIASFNDIYQLDTRQVAFREPVGDGLDLRLMSGADAREIVPSLYERWRRTRPGTFVYTPGWWEATLGSTRSYIGGGDLFAVVCEPTPGDGHGGGYVLYTMAPENERLRIDVRSLVADDPVVEARLWRFLTEVDLVDTVRASLVPTDCPLRWWLTDPRAVRTFDRRDWLHLRILDVPAALSSRGYAVDGEVTIEVHDRFRPTPATDGRFSLVVRDGASACGSTGREPDLSLDISSLGSLLLGGVRATELARAGLIRQRTPGALAGADALLGWPVAPFCPTHF